MGGAGSEEAEAQKGWEGVSPGAMCQWMPGVGWVTPSRRLLPSRAPSMLREPACLLVAVLRPCLAKVLTEKANSQ